MYNILYPIMLWGPHFVFFVHCVSTCISVIYSDIDIINSEQKSAVDKCVSPVRSESLSQSSNRLVLVFCV